MRPDYCPIGGEPCQSLCDEPCTRTPQRIWVGLTDEERKNIMVECESTGDWAWELNAAKAIEARLKERNT